MSGTGQPNTSAPARLTPIAGDLPIGTDKNGDAVHATFAFFQTIQRILSYLGQPSSSSSSGGSPATVSEQLTAVGAGVVSGFELSPEAAGLSGRVTVLEGDAGLATLSSVTLGLPARVAALEDERTPPWLPSAPNPGDGVTEIVAGPGLAGGTITSAGTISLGTVAAGDILGNSSTISAVPTAVAIGSGLTLASGTLTATTIGADEWQAGTVTNIGANLTLAAGTIALVGTPVIAGLIGSGATLSVTGVTGVGTGSGGTILLHGGGSGTGATGDGGDVLQTGGAALSTNGNGGVSNRIGGAGSGSGSGGAASSQGGSGGATGVGGQANVTGGSGGATSGNGGSVTLAGGISSGGASTGKGGAANVTGGSAFSTNGSGGNVVLTPGAKSGSGTNGIIQAVGILTVGTAAVSGANVLQVTGGASIDNLNLSGTLAAFPLGTGLALSTGSILPNYQAGSLTAFHAGLTLASGTLTPDWNGGVVTAIGSNVTLTSGTLSAGAPGTGTVTQIVAGSNLTGGTITGAGTIALQASPTIAVTTTTNPMVVNANTAAPAPALGGNLQIVGADGALNALEMDAFGTGATNKLLIRTARGTEASPAAVQANDVLFQFQVQAFGTVFSNGGQLEVRAVENWTSIAHGSAFQINAVPTGGTTQSLVAQFQADSGGVHALIGTATTIAAGGALQVVGGIGVDTLVLNGTTVLPELRGATGSIGGSPLLAGADATGTVAVVGATTGMAVSVSPVTYPGAGVFWNGYVSSAGTVTVVVGAVIALTPAASNYNVRVLQ